MTEPDEPNPVDLALQEAVVFRDAIAVKQVAIPVAGGDPVPLTKDTLTTLIDTAHDAIAFYRAIEDYALRAWDDDDEQTTRDVARDLAELAGFELPPMAGRSPEFDPVVLKATADQLASLGVPDPRSAAITFLRNLASAQEGDDQQLLLEEEQAERRPSPLPRGAEETEAQRANRFTEAVLSAPPRKLVPLPPVTAEDLGYPPRVAGTGRYDAGEVGS